MNGKTHVEITEKTSLFDSEYCEISKSTYFEELRTTAPENVFMKLRILTLYEKYRIFQHQYQKQVKMFVFISRLVFYGFYIKIQYFFDVGRNKLQTVNIGYF